MALKITSRKEKIIIISSIIVAVTIITAAIVLLFVVPSGKPSEPSVEPNISIEDNPEEEQQTEEPETPTEPTEPEEPIEEPTEPALEEDFGPESYVENSYYIKVNREMNVVMVYALDDAGEYTRLVKTFVSSVGREGDETPLGTFSVADRYEVLYLVGDVWGRFAVRISGPYFFHSVPYFTKGEDSWDDLEYLEYNKLGQGASAGCVRLAVADARWIYDHIPYGTTVEIYDSPTLPDGVVKPTPIHIDENDPNRGHDPTDY